jgi:homoserine dehydrogenase
MSEVRLAFMGFGNVGRALGSLLLRKREDILKDFDITFRVTGIATGRHGAAIDPHGIDLAQALVLVEGGDSLKTLSDHPAPRDGLDFIRACPADVLFESIPVNYDRGQPAIDYLKTALEHQMHAVTANKGPVVHAYRELTDLAALHGCKFYFESAVMDGAPLFSMFRAALPAAGLRRFRGVLNSTTNLMLKRMEEGDSFEQAVAHAQSIGIAETDPSGDIDGWDAAVKVSALVTVLMGLPLKPAQVDRTGIRGITPEAVQQARAEHKRWKLVCMAERQGQDVVSRVAPELVGTDSPLYGVQGTSSLVTFETDVLGELSIVEENPGPHTTAYGMLADFLNAVRQ